MSKKKPEEEVKPKPPAFPNPTRKPAPKKDPASEGDYQGDEGDAPPDPPTGGH